MTTDVTLDAVKALARSYFEELTNKQDVGFVDQLFTDDIAFYDPAIVPDGVAHGHAEVKQFFSRSSRSSRTCASRSTTSSPEGHKVAIRFTWTGTHTKRLLGVKIKSPLAVSQPGSWRPR